jgi:hypothetical protein
MRNPQGNKLDIYHPGYFGIETKFGFSADWGLVRAAVLRDMEELTPLNAVAPAGDYSPQDMNLGEGSWSIDPAGAQYFRPTRVSGAPTAQWLEWYDGEVHSDSEDPMAYTGNLFAGSALTQHHPRFALHLVQYAPPDGQGVGAGLVIALPAVCLAGGEWIEKGWINLVLPVGQSEYAGPFLNYQTIAEAEGAGPGRVVSQFDASSQAEEGPRRESWLFEYVEDPARYQGGHILIRRASDLGNWWHTYMPRGRLEKGTNRAWTIAMRGAIQAMNLSLIRYGQRDGYWTAYEPAPIPEVAGSEWNRDVAYGAAASPAAGWLVTAGGDVRDEGKNAYRPVITCRRQYEGSRYDRPVIWYATEDHPAVIGEPQLSSWTTEGMKRLLRVDYTLSADWRGGSGSAEFSEADADVPWLEGGAVGVWLANTKFATGYIMAEGISRKRVGSRMHGRMQLGLKLGDFTLVHMPRKEIVDCRCAAGRTVLEWARSVTNRLGLPDNWLYVDPGVATFIVPYPGLPSDMGFLAGDGDSWGSHLDEVCTALGMRWGVDRFANGSLFFDNGPPEYSGTPDFTLTIGTVTPEDMIWEIENTEGIGDKFANFLKACGAREIYAVDSLAKRKLFGQTWTKVLRASSTDDPTDRLAGCWLDIHEWKQAILWSGPLRVDLRPDKFVLIGDPPPPNIAIAAGEVYRITEHRAWADSKIRENRCGSGITAVRVA